MPFVSIVVAARNEREHICRFVDCVLSQDMTGLDWELIVSDGMSNDGTREIVADYSMRNARIRLLENPHRFVSCGLNTAIRAARGDIIVRMDAHTEYSCSYVKSCIAELERTGADNVGGPARVKAEGVWGRVIMLAYSSPFACGGARFHNCGHEGYVDTVPYGCWRKDTLMRLGLFDEQLVRNQDDELNLRLIRAGGRIWQSPRIISWYTPRSNLQQLFRQYFQYGFWKVAVVQKHRLPASWRHLIPGLFVLATVLLPVITVIAGAAGLSLIASITLAALTAMTVLYILGACVSGLAAARRDIILIPLLPIVYLVYHVAYGLGFLVGLTYWNGFRGDVTLLPFTRLTR